MAVPLCLICGRRTATYVCQDCGKAVCSNCLDPVHRSCSGCQAKLRLATAPEYIAPSQFSTATWLFFIAFAVILIGMLLITVGSLSAPSGASGGAVILIGPIPIVLGTGPYSVPLVVLAVLLTIFTLVFYFVLRRRIHQ